MIRTKNKGKAKRPQIEVVDLFCGIGGLSYGMKMAGLKILAGFDLDSTCKYAYETNTKGTFIHKDISQVKGEDIISKYTENAIHVLAGCAPCQPFSSYAFKNKEKDPNKYDLLYEFGRLIREVKPDVVTMENVPSIKNFKLKSVLSDFIKLLKEEEYKVWCNVVYCPDYGIPQTRKRLVLLASRLGDIHLISPTCSKENYVTVRHIIEKIEPLEAGQKSATDPIHKSRKLTPICLRRIQSTPEGGGWSNWEPSLRLECHKKRNGKSFGAVYGRMKWDSPAPTMTTQCTSIGSGRFGHPNQDRAISPREAALLQTFPKSYKFFKDEETASFRQLSRYIGNAVPPRLGEVIGVSILTHLNDKELSQ